MNIETVKIYDIIDSPSALTRSQGQLIYSILKDNIDKQIKTALDFSDIESIITPFLNVAIGKLYDTYSSEILQQYLILSNVPNGSESKFTLVIENAKKYYSTKAIAN